jgi:hypothetical protein
MALPSPRFSRRARARELQVLVAGNCQSQLSRSANAIFRNAFTRAERARDRGADIAIVQSGLVSGFPVFPDRVRKTLSNSRASTRTTRRVPVSRDWPPGHTSRLPGPGDWRHRCPRQRPSKSASAAGGRRRCQTHRTRSGPAAQGRSGEITGSVCWKEEKADPKRYIRPRGDPTARRWRGVTAERRLSHRAATETAPASSSAISRPRAGGPRGSAQEKHPRAARS